MDFHSALLLSTFLSCATPVVLAEKTQRTTLPHELTESLTSDHDLTYARYGNRELKLDLYRPKSVQPPLPAIVCIHGGGWFKGDRRSMTNFAQTLAARGFVTVTISYRLSGEAKFPAAIQDCKAAVRWLRANADEYGVDPEAIGATGLSAGGHLAALLATSGGVQELEGDGGHADQSSSVQACVAMGAQSDLETERIATLSSNPNNPHYRPFLGDSQQNIPEVYALASPRHHLDASDPPLLFMTGERDDPSTRAAATRDDLKQLGVPTGLKIIPKAPHAFLGKQHFFDIAVDACDSFFTMHLKRHLGKKLSQQANATDTPPLREEHDLVFADVDGHRLRLDLYLPSIQGRAPLVVWIHGGGWRGGSRKNPKILEVTKHGYALASISYRLTDKAIFPAQIHDCKAAIRWLRAHADRYGYDATWIAVAGSSAGGHLALLTGTSGDVAKLEGDVGGNRDQSSTVQAVIDYYGPSDFVLRGRTQPDRAYTEESGSFALLGGLRDGKVTPEMELFASPAQYVTADDPPLLVFHGTDDKTVLLDQSQRIVSLYSDAGLEARLVTVAGAGHGGKQFFSGQHFETAKGFLDRIRQR